MIHTRNLFRTISLAALAASFLAPAALFAEVDTGAEAPAFTLTDQSGTEHSLSDFKGKYVVLEWFNQGCPFVVKHYASGNMQELQEEYADKGVVWLTIASSAPGKQGHLTAQGARDIMAEWSMKPAAILLDEDGTVGRKYGAKTTPHMYVINPEGELIYQGAIDSIRSTDQGDVDRAGNYVVLALEAAMAGLDVPAGNTKPYGCSVKY